MRTRKTQALRSPTRREVCAAIHNLAARGGKQPNTMTRHAAAVRHPSPEHIAPPPGTYETWDDYMHAVVAADTDWHDREAQRGLKAMRLAPTIAVYQALLAGQPVPREALDPAWRDRYGL
jgi:hypothetical protein